MSRQSSMVKSRSGAVAVEGPAVEGLKAVWDRKRQIIWLAVGLLFGTFSLYPLARDDAGRTDWQYFLQLEALLVLIICVMFYVYSRKS